MPNPNFLCVSAIFMNKEGGLSHKLHGLDHLRAFAIIFVFFFHYDSNMMFLFCIAAVFIISLLLNETIEKPFLKLRKKILVKSSNT